jgi:myo-inositol-1(or 4)-monophosphatase
VEVAREAGALQLRELWRPQPVELKSWRELVTPVDRACEELIHRRVRAAWPDHGFLMEEGHVSEGGPWRWIVDPVDGTTNYARRLPAFAVSIGLEHAGRIVVAAVYAPYFDELYSARRGGGAWLERRGEAPRRLDVSRVESLGEAILGTGFAYVQNETPNDNLDNYARLSKLTRGLRRMGSAALDLAWVADGRFDGFWEMHLKPYDVAAGALLIEEAGGVVTDMFGGQDWLEGQTIVATNGRIHAAVRAQLSPVRPDPWVRIPS